MAAAAETNVVNNAYGYKNDQGETIDQSKRNGYGMTMTWNGQKADPENGIVANLSTAYMDASDEKDFTVGANALWKRFELGYIYAHNKIEDFSMDGVRASDYDDDWFNEPGSYDIHTIHASYLIPNVMNMQNFNVYLGAYMSMLDGDKTYSNDDDSEQRYGGRVRFKYFF